VNSTLIVINAWAGAQDTLERHLPHWLAVPEADLLVACPAGSLVMVNAPVVAMGPQAHSGAAAMNRYLLLLDFLRRTGYERFWLTDYDSICLAPLPTPAQPCGGSIFWGPHQGYDAVHILHPPVYLHRTTLEFVCDNPLPLADQGGFFDRWLGRLCETNNIPMADWRALGWGFSRNTIEGEDVQLACAAASRGCFLFHGVKSREVFEKIKEAYKAQ